jgi:HlyD family secretion protein
MQIAVSEGQNVTKDEPLATLSNIPLQSEYEDLRAKLALASDRTNVAHLQYTDYGTALKEREQLTAQVQQAGEMHTALELKSPIAGTVVTPKVQDLLGLYLKEGSPVLEIADLSAVRARIYISEYDLSKISIPAPARIQLDGELRRWQGKTTAIASRPTEMDPRLVRTENLSGMNQPHFYLVEILVQNPGSRLRPGMSGVARIYGKRRSVAGMGWEAIADFWSRKLW